MNFKDLMIQHGEKFALGISGTLLVGYLAIAFLLGGTDPVLNNVYSSGSAVENLLAQNHAPKDVVPPYSQISKEPWTQVAAAQPAKDGVVYFQTEMVPVIQQAGSAVVTPLERIRTHKAPTVAQPTAEIGKVSVKFSKSKDTTAPIGTYQIWRKKAAEKEFTKVHEIGGGTPKEGEEAGARGSDFAWEDTQVEAKQDYSYKVKSIARDKDPKKVDVAETESNVVTIHTVSDIEIVLKGGQETLATIVVRKYMNGKWVTKTFYVKPDGMIGEPVKEYEGSHQVLVDYSTKYKLLEIKKAKREFKRMEKVRVKDDKGLIHEEEKERVDMRDSLKITYLDDEGKKIELWQAGD